MVRISATPANLFMRPHPSRFRSAIECILMPNRSAKISTLNWDDLRLFLAASRDRSFVAAGRRMQIDQTTVARRLAALEETVGSPLFHRSPRGISLTEAGLSLVGHAEKI